MTLTMVDFFCGAGGSSQGAHAVPGVEVTLAANHWARAIESHALNFPDTDHFQGDIRDMDVAAFPDGDMFWASPECPKWSNARGKRRDFDNTAQVGMFTELEPVTDEEAERSRALMENVPQYLAAMQLRGRPVKAGVVENVIDVRAWDQWDRWVGDIRKLGYRTRLIALNSMHAAPVVTPGAPQSRDRLYLAYWLESLGRDPDWDKWLRPPAWCPTCQAQVRAVQVFKAAGRDMGRYRQQYVYRCPRVSCRQQILEPEALPAYVAIDWALPGQRIGDRAKPLADKTLARIQAGITKFARPITAEVAGNTFERRPGVRTWPVDAPLTTQTTTPTKALAYEPFMVPAGGTWRDAPARVSEPMPTRTTRENDGLAVPPFITELRGGSSVRPIGEPLSTVATSGGHHGLAVPPLLVPVEGRDGKEAGSARDPLRTQTARNETGLAWLAPFIAELRGGGSDVRLVSEALATVTASGNHHGLVVPDAATQHLLVPYYGTGAARTVTEPIGALTTRDRYALVRGEVDIDDVLFRMLEPHEIGRAMAFVPNYQVVGSKREKVRQYGNAVTPPVAEILISALVECITGEELEPAA